MELTSKFQCSTLSSTSPILAIPSCCSCSEWYFLGLRNNFVSDPKTCGSRLINRNSNYTRAWAEDLEGDSYRKSLNGPSRLLDRVALWKRCRVIFQKRVRGFHWVSKLEKHLKSRGCRPSGFIVIEHLETWWNQKHEFLKLLLQQRKLVKIIICISFLNSTTVFEAWNVRDPQKKSAWCVWSYHLIAALWQFLNIHQLMSHCYLAVCQFGMNKLPRKANGRVQI